MIGLPKELWDCITDHLNDIEAWRLRNVNHVLRQVAFDRQFNAVCLRVGHLAKLDHLQALSFLGHADVAPRVRKLCFAAGDWGPRAYRIEGLMKPTSSSLASTGLGAIIRLCSLLRWRHLSTTAHRLLTSFENVNEIFIECVYSSGRNHGVTNRELFPQIPLLVSAFETYAAKLTTISFAIGPTEAMVEVLKSFSPLPPFPHLERIAFEFRGPNYIVPAENHPILLRDNLLPFLNKHSNTITSLCLSTDEFLGLSFQFDLACLSDLEHMPKLQVLKAYLPFGSSSTTQRLRRLLEGHADTLQSMTLQVQLPYLPVKNRVTLTSLYTPLPHLRHLKITKWDTPDKPTGPLPDFMEYAARYKSTLVTLSFPRGFPNPHEEINYLSTSIWPSLTSLQLNLKTCPPEFFDTLVECFPALETLALVVTFFLGSPHDNPDATNANGIKFISNMSNRCYSSTSLREIDIMLGFHHFFNRGQPKNDLTLERACIRTIVKAFPSLTSANHMPPAELKDLLAYPKAMEPQTIEALESKKDDCWSSSLVATARVVTHPMISYDRRY